MELRELKYFLAVAREENITKAAELVNTTQPNLSRQMQKLEEEIGKPLFVRGSRRVTLTETGILLRKRAEEIVHLCEKTECELTCKAGEISGEVSIGCGESYAVRLIAKAAKRTKELCPRIDFNIFSGDGGIVCERLESGLLDFGVLIDYADLSRYDYLRLPLKDTWGVLMKKDCALARKNAVTADALRSVPLLFSQQVLNNRQHVAMNWFSQREITPNVAARYNLIYNASLLVEEGLGYALGLDKIINTSGDSNLTFRPLYPRVESHLDVVWKKYRTFSGAAEIFLEQLKKFL